MVTESLPRQGRQHELSAGEADATIEIMAGAPDVFEIQRTWERVQYIVTVVRRDDGQVLIAYLMPHPWIGGE